MAAYMLYRSVEKQAKRERILRQEEIDNILTKIDTQMLTHRLTRAEFICRGKYELIGLRFIFESFTTEKQIRIDHVPIYNHDHLYYKMLLKHYGLYTDALARELKGTESCVII